MLKICKKPAFVYQYKDKIILDEIVHIVYNINSISLYGKNLQKLNFYLFIILLLIIFLILFFTIFSKLPLCFIMVNRDKCGEYLLIVFDFIGILFSMI